jgi:pimeloyl-ACP methyl ester carboxylesterase
VDVGGRRLAYRSVGEGSPLIFCVRFWGILDSWGPAFLDALSATFRVITFDNSGLGQSTGEPSYNPRPLARDAVDLANALGIVQFVVGGWSLGGQAAQVVAALHPDRVTHAILIGTTPPGKTAHGPEPVFFERALKYENDFDDETVLFFEPASDRSRAAAKASHDRIAQRTAGKSPPIPEEVYLCLLGENTSGDLFADDGNYRDTLSRTRTPILVISGDHEIVFPVQNWFELNRSWGALHLMVLPGMGHGSQHEAPDLCADLIGSFVRNRHGTETGSSGKLPTGAGAGRLPRHRTTEGR